MQKVREFEPRHADRRLAREARKLKESWRTYEDETRAVARKLSHDYKVCLYEFVIRGLLWGGPKGFLVVPRFRGSFLDLYVYGDGERPIGVLNSWDREYPAEAADKIGACPLEVRRVFAEIKQDLQDHKDAWLELQYERRLPHNYQPDWDDFEAVVARVKENREKAAAKAKRKRRSRKAAPKLAKVFVFAGG